MRSQAISQTGRTVRSVLDAIVVMDDGRLARDGAMEQELERRFDEVQAALVEQRQYTEFAFERLSAEMRNGFAQVGSRFDRLERKLDQFIDTQSKTNELVERRLRALER